MSFDVINQTSRTLCNTSRRCTLVLMCLLAIPLTQVQAVPGDDKSGSVADTSTVPDWTVQLVSDAVKNATALCFDDDGNIYVTETYRWTKGIEDNRDHTYWIMDDLACDTVEQRGAYYAKWKERFQEEDYFTRYSDRVVKLTDSNGDGTADKLTEFATGFDKDVTGPAIGLLYGHGGVYMTCVPNLWKLEDTDKNGVADKKEILQGGFGVKTSLSGHDLHGLVWGPDGKLYFSMGDRGFNCTTREGRQLKDTNSGAVFRCNPDGSQMELFYHQLRNPQELAFNEYGDLFTVDNNCDQGDSARVCYLLEGGTTGWNLGAQALTTYGAYIDDGELDQVPHWLGEGVWKLRHPDQPAHILPPIGHLTNGPSGLTFNSGIGFPEAYQNHFLVCDYKGAPNLCFLYSFKTERDQAGYRVREEHIVRGGIPVTDVEIGFDGKIYVTDFGGGWKRSDRGNVYALFDAKTNAQAQTARLGDLFAAGFEGRDTVELIELLAHQDMRVRLRSQFALAARGRAIVQALASVARDPQQSLARYHAIWGLGQLKATAAISPLLSDPDAEIRAQAARTLGNINAQSSVAQLRERLSDESGRVRTFAAIALGKIGTAEAVPELVEYARRNNDVDAFERHAAVFALSQLASADSLASLTKDDSDAVRLAAVLALRRQQAPEVARFLVDAKTQIAVEAIRAINDENIIAAVPSLAEAASALTSSGSAPGVSSEFVFRRLLNACLRSGSIADAVRLVEIGSNTKLSLAHRVLALEMLPLFDKPPTIDPTLGIYRPLEPRDASAIGAAIETPLRQVFETSTGDLAAAAIVAMRHYGMKLSDAELVRRVRDGRQPEEVRAAALRQLYDEKRYDQKVLLQSLLVDASPMIRAEAIRGYTTAFPDEAATAITVLMEKESDSDLRTAYEILAASDDPKLTSILANQLDLMLAGNLYRTVQLDLYQAAKQHPATEIQARVARIDEQLAADGNSVYDFAREGGDPVAGQLVFQNQGVCMKCHKAKRGGGDAGPTLANIGRLRRSHELLESILDPNAVVVEGYGTITVFLDDGTSANGTLVSRDANQVTLKLPTGETKTMKQSEIEEISEITSPMPKQAQNLTLEEVRDLVAFLSSLGFDEE